MFQFIRLDRIGRFRFLHIVTDKYIEDVTPKGVKKFFSSQFYKDYEKAMEKRKYWAERRKQETV